MPVVALPEHETVKLVFGSKRTRSDQEFVAFCRANPDLRLERTTKGEIVIVPPAGIEGSYRSMKASAQLERWADKDGHGKAFDSSAGFTLSDGAVLSPDAAWVSNDALERLSIEERREFAHLCPEFVIEVMSPSDQLKPAMAKMEQWIANGVQLGWLIDGDNQTVYVYRKGRPPVTRRGVQELAGEGAVKGFVLKLDSIWRGLR